jgi:L-iditol 2-dehydrogenase
VTNYRLRIARQCGLELCVNPNETSLTAAVDREFGPDRPDLILECVGINQTTEQAIQNARKGTDIIIVASVRLAQQRGRS